jgi:hypothetical protein
MIKNNREMLAPSVDGPRAEHDNAPASPDSLRREERPMTHNPNSSERRARPTIKTGLRVGLSRTAYFIPIAAVYGATDPYVDASTEGRRAGGGTGGSTGGMFLK